MIIFSSIFLFQFLTPNMVGMAIDNTGEFAWLKPSFNVSELRGWDDCKKFFKLFIYFNMNFKMIVCKRSLVHEKMCVVINVSNISLFSFYYFANNASNLISYIKRYIMIDSEWIDGINIGAEQLTNDSILGTLFYIQ